LLNLHLHLLLIFWWYIIDHLLGEILETHDWIHLRRTTTLWNHLLHISFAVFYTNWRWSLLIYNFLKFIIWKNIIEFFCCLVENLSLIWNLNWSCSIKKLILLLWKGIICILSSWASLQLHLSISCLDLMSTNFNWHLSLIEHFTSIGLSKVGHIIWWTKLRTTYSCILLRIQDACGIYRITTKWPISLSSNVCLSLYSFGSLN
jgi:hypothetical protein